MDKFVTFLLGLWRNKMRDMHPLVLAAKQAALRKQQASMEIKSRQVDHAVASISTELTIEGESLQDVDSNLVKEVAAKFKEMGFKTQVKQDVDGNTLLRVWI